MGGHGGMDYYDFSLCESLVNHQITPLLLTCDKTAGAGISFDIWRVYINIFGADSSWRRGLRFVWGSLKGLTRARTRGTDLAHFHFFHIGPLEYFNVALARLLLMKVVITAHDVESFKPGKASQILSKLTYGMASAVIAHNRISQLELIDKLEIPSEKIHIIRHGNYEGYGLTTITRDEACAAVGVPSDEFIVMFFGQIKEVKGLDVLVRAMPEMLKGVTKRVRLVIAGKVWKDDFSKYQLLIDELDLTNIVKLDIRYIPDSELASFYRAANVLVLPYRRIYQSGVVLMAMTFGTPVVVSDIPGMLEVVTHDENGLVFKDGDFVDLSNKLIDAALNPEKLAKYAKNACALMQTQYAWSGIGKQTADLYRKILIT